jgi:hypothetical protein
MRIASKITLSLLLTLLLGAGVATWSRAQQAADRPVARGAKTADLRERVIALRTEVDVLQLEADGLRAALTDWSRDMAKADLMGIDMGAVWGMAKLDLGGISGDAAALQQMRELTGALNADDPATALKATQNAAKKGKDDIQAAFERKKKEFARTARLLNEKKLDLAEVEKQYQREN